MTGERHGQGGRGYGIERLTSLVLQRIDKVGNSEMERDEKTEEEKEQGRTGAWLSRCCYDAIDSGRKPLTEIGRLL